MITNIKEITFCLWAKEVRLKVGGMMYNGILSIDEYRKEFRILRIGGKEIELSITDQFELEILSK